MRNKFHAGPLADSASLALVGVLTMGLPACDSDLLGGGAGGFLGGLLGP